MKTKIQKTSFPAAFTLIELLVVISIIGVLSAFIIGGLAAAKKISYRKTATADLKFIEAAIENYKAKYGSYPPSNQNLANVNYDPSSYSQLYYELSGVTNTTPPPSPTANYKTLDGSATISEGDYKLAFGVGGIVNLTKPGGDDGVAAQNFLSGLKAKQFRENLSNNTKLTTLLITSVGGPDINYQPLGVQDVNPIHYNSVNPTNNPSSYDLWIDLVISGKTNRIGNWTAK